MNAELPQLIASAASGDRMAFRQLVLDHSPAVFRLAFRLTRNEALAEDVVQEAFLKAYRKLARFDRRSSFSTWIHRITVNAAMDALRKQRSRERIQAADSMPAETQHTECPAESQDIQRQTEQALGDLSDMERAAFTLRHFEGHSIREICGILDLNSGACKQAIFRAVRKMRASLQPLMSA